MFVSTWDHFAGEVVLGLIPSVHKYFNRARLIIMTIMIIMMMIIIILMRDCLAGIRLTVQDLVNMCAPHFSLFFSFYVNVCF